MMHSDGDRETMMTSGEGAMRIDDRGGAIRNEGGRNRMMKGAQIIECLIGS